jgi:hypothetical protein
MNNKRCLALLCLLLVQPLMCVILAANAEASQEGILKWSSFSIDSAGIGTSGPVSIAGKQDASGITAMTVKAFGRTYELKKDHLDKLEAMHMNGMQLSYEGGYKELGGRTLYIQLSRGFIASGVTHRKLIVVTERGDVTVKEWQKN